MSREYNDSMDGLKFSPAAKKRLAANLAAAQEQARPEVCAARGGRRRWRYAAAAAATVVLAVGLAGGAYATGALMSVGNVFDDLFGGPPAQTEVVDKIGRPIGASATSNGVTVTAEAIIGDRANYVVVYSIAKDDGTALGLPEAGPGDTLPLMFCGGAHTNVDGVTGAGGSAYFYDADPSDNAIQYVEKMSVDSMSGSIVGSTARAHFQDLGAIGQGASDADAEVVAAGAWDLKFTVNYEDTSVDLPAGQTFDLGGMGATLDSASLSPIALTLAYTAGEELDWQDQDSGRMSDRNASQLDRFLNPAIALNLKDGTVVEIDASHGAGGTHEGAGTTSCRKNIMFDEFLNTDDVASVTIGGTEIPFA